MFVFSVQLNRTKLVGSGIPDLTTLSLVLPQQGMKSSTRTGWERQWSSQCAPWLWIPCSGCVSLDYTMSFHWFWHQNLLSEHRIWSEGTPIVIIDRENQWNAVQNRFRCLPIWSGKPWLLLYTKNKHRYNWRRWFWLQAQGGVCEQISVPFFGEIPDGSKLLHNRK